MVNVSKKLIYIVFCLSILLALIGVQPAYAASIVVNTAVDENNTGSDCSLREAITAAEIDTPYGGCPNGAGSDTITFAANYTITLSSQLPIVTGTIIINGNGAANTIIQANAAPNTATYRVFENQGDLTLNNLTVRHGRCNGSCATYATEGGGIVNYGTLTVTNSVISNNSASVAGGGIFSNVELTVTNSTISNNSADSGGGIRNEAIADITNSTISNNSAADQGGGIFNYSGTLTVIKSTISNNSASTQGGGILNFNQGTLTLANSTLSGNSALLDGGGIYNNSAQPLTLTNSTLSGNSADSGGGISNFNGTLNLINTIIANSTTGGDCFNNGSNGIIGSNSNNLIEAIGTSACELTNGSNNNIIGSDPALGSITGSPAYFPLNTGSLAINAGSNPNCAANPVNNESQNGVARPSGGTCDIGSYEKSSIPTSSTFGDVPTSHPYFSDIEILYANGLTAGCSTTPPLLFCPDVTMNRAQSAVFMVRGNFGTSYTPPAAPWTTFGDDFSPGTWAQPWAQGMFDAGLTAGCSTNPRLFCPWEEMPRFQAAVFGIRLKYGNSYPPPAGSGTVFADINGSEWFAGWAEQAYAEGLLPACGSLGGKPLFCPNDLVPRGLAAYMIVRAKNLTMP